MHIYWKTLILRSSSSAEKPGGMPSAQNIKETLRSLRLFSEEMAKFDASFRKWMGSVRSEADNAKMRWAVDADISSFRAFYRQKEAELLNLVTNAKGYDEAFVSALRCAIETIGRRPDVRFLSWLSGASFRWTEYEFGKAVSKWKNLQHILAGRDTTVFFRSSAHPEYAPGDAAGISLYISFLVKDGHAGPDNDHDASSFHLTCLGISQKVAERMSTASAAMPARKRIRMLPLLEARPDDASDDTA